MRIIWTPADTSLYGDGAFSEKDYENFKEAGSFG